MTELLLESNSIVYTVQDLKPNVLNDLYSGLTPAFLCSTPISIYSSVIELLVTAASKFPIRS